MKKEINLNDAFLIGVFQALAIIPGVSRSGAVITAGRFLGSVSYTHLTLPTSPKV